MQKIYGTFYYSVDLVYEYLSSAILKISSGQMGTRSTLNKHILLAHEKCGLAY